MTMKKIMTNIKTLAALLMAVAGTTACSSEDDIAVDTLPQKPAEQTYTMTVEASKGSDATTRALSLDGTTLNATWTEGDKVEVWSSDGTTVKYGTLTAQSSGSSTTLTGEMDFPPTLSTGLSLLLKYLSNDYSKQTGTLDYIASHCDYATARVKLTGISGSEITTTPATFQNQQAIVKFTLKDSDGTAISAWKLTVSDGTNTYTVTPASDTSELFVAIPGISSQTLTLTANAGSATYTYEKSDVTFTNGKYYAVTVKMSNTHSAGDVEAATVGSTNYVKVYTSATAGYYVMCTDYATNVNWATACGYSVTEAGKTFTCGTKAQWEAIMTACGYYNNIYGWRPINSKCSGVTGWTAMSGYYWSSTEHESDNTRAYYFLNEYWNSYANDKTKGMSVRLICPFQDTSNYVKVYTSDTSGYYIMCTDYATNVNWATACGYSVTEAGKTFTCGTKAQWEAIMTACGYYNNIYGWRPINSKCSGVTGWTAMSGYYWSSTEHESDNTRAYYFLYDYWNSYANDKTEGMSVRLISAF